MIRRARDGSDPPETRIPVHERLVADLGVRVYASFVSPKTILRRFRTEAERAIALSERLTPEQGARPVRIRRFPGIESDSRHWSVYMTLDHLVMVNTAITALIHAICSDRHHGIEIRLEDVRPHPDAGPDRIEALAVLVERYAHQIERFGPLTSRGHYAHPWFGSLTARQWHALATLHNRMHRVQIEKILRRLD
ncbi:hypothetical protein ThidrDRAFT_0041 [Thiorhodococcus drewsii AZ1]|uniref:DinB-like domain-containing protein n=1 Tax=Thiorhodococcus drewsii AZ1 TaxID=765913 RepID=G2DVY0_9GAMM|nr:hypothetical protein [Thiorhodococcus drewsii]EGV33886.1 hypothetical protein ThidrDRAFT_0041 [Thiorhodococcus drewsii AZ1]